MKIRGRRGIRFRDDPLDPLDGGQKGEERSLNLKDNLCPLFSQQGDIAAELESVAEPLFAIHKDAAALEGRTVPAGLGVDPLINRLHGGKTCLVIGKTGSEIPGPEQMRSTIVARLRTCREYRKDRLITAARLLRPPLLAQYITEVQHRFTRLRRQGNRPAETFFGSGVITLVYMRYTTIEPGLRGVRA
ncbi:MAG: hypothetical protein P4L44_06200 [Oryzomonas sp.]|nr:hypothetical protein [Oryzomonas sp.]MDR3579533.1 hypothetical protein [Oryzomonas sp.]